MADYKTDRQSSPANLDQSSPFFRYSDGSYLITESWQSDYDIRRSDETVSDRYASFIIDEILTDVRKSYSITDDPNLCGIGEMKQQRKEKPVQHPAGPVAIAARVTM